MSYQWRGARAAAQSRPSPSSRHSSRSTTGSMVTPSASASSDVPSSAVPNLPRRRRGYDPEVAAALEEMRRRLAGWMERVDDPLATVGIWRAALAG